MFQPTPERTLTSDPHGAPRLLVVIDTEEEFRWDSFSATSTSIKNIACQHEAQTILNRYGLAPTYAVDYPVAAQADGVRPLKEWLDDGLCEIGAQLHTWVTPPFEEEISLRNTYQCNLPEALERTKIAILTQHVAESFGVSPRLFKAGRHGFGKRTVGALIEHGYTIDNSVLPYADLAPHGPNHTGSPRRPFWLDEACRLLEVPTSAGLIGAMRGIDETTAMGLLGPLSAALKVPAVLARFGLLDRIRLTPEGISLDEAKRLTLSLLTRGQRLFVLCYHSSSLLPGGTPYVKSEADKAAFLRWLEDYLTFFFGPLCGQPATQAAVLAEARLRASAIIVAPAPAPIHVAVAH